jgi:hypothetical protein
MDPTTRKIRYDGSACVNARSIEDACNLLSPESSPDQPLTFSDLAKVLWFVETCVTSKALFFDGTVPLKTVDRTLDAVDRLKRNNELRKFGVSSIAFASPEAILEAARDAFAESSLLVDNFAVDPAADRPLEQSEHDNFVENLAKAKPLGESQREDLALSWVGDAFRGSKCLAAAIVNGDAYIDTIQRIYDSHRDQGPLISGALINRFRLNYVNHLAAKKQSAYVPNPTFEALTREHVRLFKDFLIGRIVKNLDVRPDDHNLLVENMKAETPLPPIGLYALMATRTRNRPVAILETAFNAFRQDDSLMKLIWTNTKGGMARQKSHTEDEISEIEAYFYDNYVELEKEALGIKALTSSTRSARTYLIPAILKGIVKAIPETIPVLGPIVFSVLREVAVESSIPFISDKLLGAGCDSYISQYKSMKFDFEKNEAVRAPLAKLSAKVETVFGRKLV